MAFCLTLHQRFRIFLVDNSLSISQNLQIWGFKKLVPWKNRQRLSLEEFQTKLSILRALLDKHGADGLLLRRVSSFAWATCGASSYINIAATEGAASLVITRDAMYLATNNIEAPRLQDEEHLAEQGWEFVISPWQMPMQGLQALIAGKSLVSDVPFPNAKDIGPEIARLRASLTPEEGERFRQLGKLCAETITAAAQAIQPGMSEFELAALLGGESQKRGIQPIVNLIATDERAYRYRHPLPTAKKMEKYALLVLCGRWRGLVCSVSRLVHFGRPPAELESRIRATAQVNAAFIAHSRPGSTLRDILPADRPSMRRQAIPTNGSTTTRVA